MIHEAHSNLLRGLIWCISLVPRDSLIGTVGDVAEICVKKIPGIGPRAPKISNACLAVLAEVSTSAAVAQLSRLKTQAKHTSTRKQLGKAFESAATKAGMTPDELEEIAVPTGGFTEVGSARWQLGEFTALLQVDDRGHADLSWLRSAKTQRTVPAALKATHSEKCTLDPAHGEGSQQPLNRSTSSVGEAFAQRTLLVVHGLSHKIFGSSTDWDYCPAFSLVSGRRSREMVNGIWHDGRLVDERNQAIDGQEAGTRVSLWHPLKTSVDQVEAWRTWLEGHTIRCQPFTTTAVMKYMSSPRRSGERESTRIALLDTFSASISFWPCARNADGATACRETGIP